MDFPAIDGRYVVEGVLGRGRISVVYRARDQTTGRAVAIKVLQPYLRAQASVVQRFKREMAAVQRLEHEAIVRVFDVVETAEHVALVMEFAAGETLQSRVRARGAMEPARVERLARTLLEAVAHAHGRGVLHRDLHLENVIVDEGNGDRIEIIGFGLARVDELVSLTMHTRVLGALETMAPEVILGKAADAQADIFSVGAMLYELLVGRALHDGRMSSALQFASGEDYLAAVRERLEGVLKGKHPGLMAAVMRALVPDATLRFATATQMRDALLGGYDEATWCALERRKPVHCSQCERMLLEGFRACVYCGQVPDPMAESKDLREYAVQVDVPSTASTGALYELSSEQLRGLYEVMFSHEETKWSFEVKDADRFPPYVLCEGVNREGAQEISALLHRRGIHNSIGRIFTGELQEAQKRSSSGGALEKLAAWGLVLSSVLVFVFAFVLLFIPESGEIFVRSLPLIGALTDFQSGVLLAFSALMYVVFFIAINDILDGYFYFLRKDKRNESSFFKSHFRGGRPVNRLVHGLAGGLAACLGAYLFYQLSVQDKILDASWTTATLACGFIAFGLGTTLGFGCEGWLRARFKRAREVKGILEYEPDPYREYRSLMNRELADHVLPEYALRALREVENPTLQQEFHHLLVLIIRLFRDYRVPSLSLQEALAPLWEQIVLLLNELSALDEAISARNPEELLSAMAALENELESSLDMDRVEVLLAQRSVYLNELDLLDKSVHKTSLLRGHLLQVRATLLGLQAEFGKSELPSIEVVKDEISALRFDFEARREVQMLVEQA